MTSSPHLPLVASPSPTSVPLPLRDDIDASGTPPRTSPLPLDPSPPPTEPPARPVKKLKIKSTIKSAAASSTGLFAFRGFGVILPEKYEDQKKVAFQSVRNDRDQLAAAKAKADEEKAQSVRDGARMRKRKSRMEERERKGGLSQYMRF